MGRPRRAKYIQDTVLGSIVTEDLHGARQRRVRLVRAKTFSIRSMTKRALALGRLSCPDGPELRPVTRADCEQIARPCPFVSCKYNLYLDVTEAGSIKLNFPEIEPHQMIESCALDVAENGGESLEYVGEHLNMTRERVRQVQDIALSKLARRRRSLPMLSDFSDISQPENIEGEAE